MSRICYQIMTNARTGNNTQITFQHAGCHAQSFMESCSTAATGFPHPVYLGGGGNGRWVGVLFKIDILNNTLRYLQKKRNLNRQICVVIPQINVIIKTELNTF